MAKLVAREKKLQETRERNEKTIAEREQLLKRFLEPDALTYLEGMKTKEPVIGKRIQDILLYLIVYRGLRQMITQIDIRYVERQIKGEGPTIKVQRDGETSDFGAYVREAIKADEDDTESD